MSVLENKRMLVIKASSDVPSCETKFLEPLGEMLGFEVAPEVHLTNGKVGSALDHLVDDAYDFVYLCGHGNKWVLGGNQRGKPVAVSWPQLSGGLCQALRPEATIILGCCEGGLRTVAYDFFNTCDQLRHVFGLSSSVTAQDLMLALHVVLSGVMSRSIGRSVDGTTAARRASKAIGREVLYYDGDDHRYTQEYWTYSDGGGQAVKYSGYVNYETELDSDDYARKIIEGTGFEEPSGEQI